MQSRRSLAAVLAPWLVVLPALAGAPAVRAQERASALDALPGDTTFVVRLRNLTDSRKKFKASPLSTLLENPEVKRFIDGFTKKTEEEMADVRAKLGFNPIDLLALVEGEALFAVGSIDKVIANLAAVQMGGPSTITPNDVPVILVVDAGASAPKLKENLAKLFEFAQKEGAKKDVADFQGGKITTLLQPKGAGKKDAKDAKDAKAGKDDDADEEPEKGGLEKMFFGELGSRFLVGINRPFLEQTMANLSQTAADSLSKSADFTATLREVGSEADFLTFLNIRPVALSARKHLQANPMGAMVLNIVEGKLLGRSLKNIGITGTLRENDLQDVVFVNNGGASDGILGILKGPPFPGRPSPLIPEDADQFSSLSLNIPTLYALIKDIYSTAMSFQAMAGGGAAGGAPPDLDQFLQMQLGIDVKKLVDSMGNMLHIYQKGGQTPDKPIPNITIALELKDEGPAKELLGKMTLMTGAQPAKYLDRDIYAMPGNENGPALAITDKYLVFGMTGDGVKDVVRRSGKGGKSVAETPGYQSLAGSVPSQVNVLSYNSGKSIRDALKMYNMLFMGMGWDIAPPDMTVLADVINGGIGYGIWKEGGFFMNSFLSLKKGGGTKPAAEEKK